MKSLLIHSASRDLRAVVDENGLDGGMFVISE